jgi:hypothetical protein
MGRFMKIPFILIFILLCAGITWSEAPSNACAGKCHIIKPYVESFGNPNLLVSKHKEQGLNCESCHERSAETVKEEKARYKNKEYSDPIEQRLYEADFCLTCHESYKAVAERTQHLKEEWGRNPHESHMGEIDCSECHKMHGPSKFICSECHKSNWQERLPKGWVSE